MAMTLPSGTFFGERRLSQAVAGFILTDSLYRPALSIPVHTHENAFFYVVLQGTCRESCGKTARTSGPGALIYHPPGETHANDWPIGGQCLHIEITSRRLECLREYSAALDSPAEFQDGPPVWLAARLYNEFQRSDNVSPLAMEGLTLELLAAVSRCPIVVAESRAPRWLEQVRERLQAQFAESLSLDVVAATVGVHPAHLARVFRQQYHCTIGDYIRRLRVEYACREMHTSDTPLVDIALAAGFSDQSHLSRTFKSIMGMTPTEFRKQFPSCKSGASR